jgi:hypothetical protein
MDLRPVTVLFGPSPGFGKIRPGDLVGVWKLSHCDQMPRGRFIPRARLSDFFAAARDGRPKGPYIFSRPNP